jgi:hypothetical protein
VREKTVTRCRIGLSPFVGEVEVVAEATPAKEET